MRRVVCGGAAMVGAALLVVVALSAPAAASTGGRQVSAAPRGEIVRYTPVPADGRVSCFGYYGTFLGGSHVMVVDWTTASDECFGIATDRTIWHTWPASGGWKRMGGNGHADEVAGIVDEDPAGTRGVIVHANSNDTDWYQLYALPGGWTGVWSRL